VITNVVGLVAQVKKLNLQSISAAIIHQRLNSQSVRIHGQKISKKEEKLEVVMIQKIHPDLP